jgi:hypothetical protein
MGTRQPKKQIKVVSTSKRKTMTNRKFQEAPDGQIPLPRKSKHQLRNF